MKDNQYKNRFRKGMLLIIICMLFIPVELISENHPHEIDIGTILSINCPNDIVQANDAGLCSAVVYYTPPANSFLVSGPASGDIFNVGETTVTYQENGGSETCSFTVTVNDAEPPVFIFIIPPRADQRQR